MNHKDYKLLAKAIAEAHTVTSKYSDASYSVGLDIGVQKLCDALLVDNHKFDKEKFIAAIVEYEVK